MREHFDRRPSDPRPQRSEVGAGKTRIAVTANKGEFGMGVRLNAFLPLGADLARVSLAFPPPQTTVPRAGLRFADPAMNPRYYVLLSPAFRAGLWLVAGLVLLDGAASSLTAKANDDTLVVSHVYNDYTRTKATGGGFKPETYAFAEGGLFDDVRAGNDTVSAIGFSEVARTIADALKTQSYVSSNDPEKVDLMIMLWYGTTMNLQGAYKPEWFQELRVQNTRILGFAKEQSKADSLSFTTIASDFYDEFYADRYFVVLKAYDFQVARKEKRLKLLWESRFSIRRQRADFATDLPAMSKFAALTFGRETDGILRPDSLKSNVELGELRVLGEANK
jgi:hypothetical protein